MKFAAALAALAGAVPAQAYFILSQPILETTRLDPIVFPGVVSAHVHTIAGGSNFDKTQTFDSMQQGSCTTAPITIDKSNYWAPQLYYYSPDEDAFEMIPVSYMNAYYLPRAGSDGIVKAFPEGLRMISGNPYRRTFNASSPDDLAISYVCLDYSGTHTDDPAWAQRNSFFAHNCPSGMRAQVNFRPCWDGVNLDSDDHASHMAWPSGGVDGGDCPASHPVHLVSLFYEFIFEVQNFPFNNASYPTWVLAPGDSTGYAFHGDFISGWPTDLNGTNVLQDALDQCNADSGVGGELYNCPPLVPYYNPSAADACTPENPLVDEDIGSGHYIKLLPGDNPLWFNGTTATEPAAATATTPGLVSPSSVLPSGWTHTGCIAEGASGRALTAASFSNANMTRAACVDYCASFGYPLAGTEYADECYCGYAMANGASNTTLLAATSCGDKCADNDYETCGGSSTLDLFVNPALFPAPVVLPTGWVAGGCVTEATNARALAAYSFTSSSMTPTLCIQTCQAKGYKLAGIEYADECYCANSYSAGAVAADSTSCNMNCAGLKSSICGGSDRLTTYNYTLAALSSSSASATKTSTSVSTSSSAKTSTSTSAKTSTTSSATTSTISTSKTTSATTSTTTSATTSKTTSSTTTTASSKTSTTTSSSTTSTTSKTTTTTAATTAKTTASTTTTSTAAATTSTKPVVLPTGWSSLGCIHEPTNTRALASYSTSSSSMTTELCISTCQSQGYLYAGTEYASQCYCSSALSSGYTNVTSASCKMACAGNANETCGGSSTLSLYVSANASIAYELPTSWTDIGCYTEASSGRALAGYSFTSSVMTPDLCINTCASKGYLLAGTEYSTECYCADIFTATSVSTTSGCTMACGGNKGVMCGGSDRLNVYQSNQTIPVETLPTNWTSVGCYTEGTSARALASYTFSSSSMTPDMCISECAAKGYIYAGTEYSTECYCADAFSTGAVAASSGCTMLCGGDQATTCGGMDRLNVYLSNQTQPAATVPAGWTSLGCYSDSSTRTLGEDAYTSGSSMTWASCTAFCAKNGFAYAGTEDGYECYCASAIGGKGAPTDASKCATPCRGAADEMCGGVWALNVFVSDSAATTTTGTTAASTATKASRRRRSRA